MDTHMAYREDCAMCMNSEPQRELAAEARIGGRLLTKGLAAYFLPKDNPSAQVILAGMENASPVGWRALWITHFEPSMGLGRIAAMKARGFDDPTPRLTEAAFDWPIYRAAPR